jgi:ABC-type glycerol-3-phosphate transport system permease component
MRRQRGALPWRGALLAVFLLPLGWAVVGSLDVSPDGRGVWIVQPSLEHYHEVLTGSMGLAEATAQSIVVGIAAAVLAVCLGYLGAVALRGIHSRWAHRLPPVLLLLSLMPPLTYGPAVADGARAVGLFDSLVGLVLIEAGLTFPLAFWVLVGYVGEVPRDVEEAAALDGSRFSITLWHILLPATWPGVMATLVVVFVVCWNLFDVPSLLSFSRLQTVPIVLSSFVSYEKDLEWPPAAASLIVGMLPAFVAIALAQRVLRSFAPLGSHGEER